MPLTISTSSIEYFHAVDAFFTSFHFLSLPLTWFELVRVDALSSFL